MNDFIDQKDNESASEVWDKIIKVQDQLQKEATEAGWTVQAIAKFKKLDNTTAVWVVKNEIEKANQRKYPKTDINKLKESSDAVNKMAKDISDDVVNDDRLKNVISDIDKTKKKRVETNTEKAAVLANKIRKIKSSNWGITLAADPISSIGIGVLDGAVEVTAKTIEVTGNIADAIQKGINHIKNSDWYKSLTNDQKRKIERVFASNMKKEAGIDNLSKADIDKLLKQEMKDLGLSINKIIKDYWSKENELNILLSERLYLS